MPTWDPRTGSRGDRRLKDGGQAGRGQWGARDSDVSIRKGAAAVAAAPVVICRRRFLREINISVHCTVRLTVVEWTMLPLVPVMIKEYIPAAAFLLVSTVNVELPEFTTDGGLNLMLEFLGAPLRVNVTVPEKPEPPAMVTVYVPTPPLLIVALAGDAEIAKSPLTTSVTLTL